MSNFDIQRYRDGILSAMLSEGLRRTSGQVGAGLRQELSNLEISGLSPIGGSYGIAADPSAAARILGRPVRQRGVLDYNNMLVRNPHLRDALSALRDGMDREGYADVPIVVTGGESYYDSERNGSYSLSNESYVKNRDRDSAHHVEHGARDVDLRNMEIADDEFIGILREYTPFARWEHYSDGHWHLGLPPNLSCPEGICVR